MCEKTLLHRTMISSKKQTTYDGVNSAFIFGDLLGLKFFFGTFFRTVGLYLDPTELVRFFQILS